MNLFKKNMILYHAISSYQLYEVIMHCSRYNKYNYNILLLPDFIVEKYPNWKELVELTNFKEVILFPYTKIPHIENNILERLNKVYNEVLPYEINRFKNIYVAGAHFYFSIYLIEKEIGFNVFEDAAGMFVQGNRLEFGLKKTFPIHAKIAKKYGLFDLKNPFIKKIICIEKQKIIDKRIVFFSPNRIFEKKSKKEKIKIFKFFGIDYTLINIENTVLIITQNFSGLGVMTIDEQIEVYKKLYDLNKDNNIIIKSHPDDIVDYKKIFQNAKFLPSKVPLEIISTLFKGRPKKIIAFSSTALHYLSKKYPTEDFSQNKTIMYDYNNEYASINKILNI